MLFDLGGTAKSRNFSHVRAHRRRVHGSLAFELSQVHWLVRDLMNTASNLGPHTQTDRGTYPGVGALSSSSKDATLQGGMMVVLRTLFAAALVVCRRYFIVAPSPFLAAQLVVHRS